MKNLNKKIILASTLIALFASCGSSGGGSSNDVKPTIPKNIAKIPENHGTINYGLIGKGGISVTNEEDGIIEMADGDNMAAVTSQDKISKGINKGKILATNPMVAYGGGTVINDTKGTILLKNTQNSAMSASESSIAINRGEITTTDFYGTGMSGIEGSKITNEQTGIINAKNFGMSVRPLESGKTTTAMNYGTINMIHRHGSGMFAMGSKAEITNNGNINMNGTDGSGMFARDGGTGLNNKTITMGNSDGETNAGMNSANSGFIKNAKSGIITITDGTKGMNIESNSTGENYGLITVKGKNSIGMLANGSNTKAINHGKIELLGEKSVGMEAQNGGIITNETDGEIILNGTGTNIDESLKNQTLTVTDSTLGTSPTSIKIADYTDNHQNQAFKIDKNSKFVNKGKITFKGNK